MAHRLAVRAHGGSGAPGVRPPGPRDGAAPSGAGGGAVQALIADRAPNCWADTMQSR